MNIQEQHNIGKHGEMITLRSLHKEDAKQWIAYTMSIAQESDYMVRYPEEVEVDLTKAQSGLAWMSECKSGGYIGAFIGQTLAGNFGLYQVGERLRISHRCAIGLGVRKEYRNCGVAKCLLEAGIAWARSLGYEQMELDVVEENKAAIHLYESCGFVSTGKIPHGFKMKDGRYYDLRIMVKSLVEPQKKSG